MLDGSSMRYVWLLGMLVVGCDGEQVTTDEADADTDADADSDTDADTDADIPDTFLTNFQPDCTNTTAIGPASNESNHLAAALIGPAAGLWPYRVDEVKVALSNESQDVLACDASQAHTVSVWVLEPGDTRPPTDTPPDQVLSFGAQQALDPVRLLEGTLDPPITLTNGQNLAIGLQFAGSYPDSSCIVACNSSPVSGVDFWSNAASAPYNWVLLEDFGIEGNLWIFAVGTPLE